MAPDFDAPLDFDADGWESNLPPGPPRDPGSVKGMLIIVDDADDLADFSEYL